MANPNGNPAGKGPDAFTQEHGQRVTISMRWPAGIIARVDRRAAELTLAEGRVVSRTEFALRAVVNDLEAQGVPVVEGDAAVPAVDGSAVEELRAERETCTHPKDALRNLGYMTRCGICGKRMDR